MAEAHMPAVQRPDLSSCTQTLEWEIVQPCVAGGDRGDPQTAPRTGQVLYFRDVTYDVDSGKRELVVYWGSLEEATPKTPPSRLHDGQRGLRHLRWCEVEPSSFQRP